jgi:hypothetical protein
VLGFYVTMNGEVLNSAQNLVGRLDPFRKKQTESLSQAESGIQIHESKQGLITGDENAD